MNTGSQQTTSPSGLKASPPATTCQVMFFRTFDLAEFFTNRSDPKGLYPKNGPIRFLKNRTEESMRKLFRYDYEQSAACSSTPLDQFFPDPFDFALSKVEDPRNERKEETKAYQEGWVRGTLLNQFISPTYRYSKKVLEVIPKGTEIETECNVYRSEWLSSEDQVQQYLGENALTISLLPYGIASVRLEISVPIEARYDNGAEFTYVQNVLRPLFSSHAATSKLQKFAHYPSLLTFIALSTIWQFLNGLQTKMEDEKQEWWVGENAGTFVTFDKVWSRSTNRPFPLRHETAYYYFESSRYGQRDGPIYSDSIMQLGLCVTTDESDATQENLTLFSMKAKDNMRDRDLCVTDNGVAYVVGSSLVVAVKPEKYSIQGTTVTEGDYWRWMFRLLCCIRECFILCDIGSRDTHCLRERYDSLRGECFQEGKLLSITQEKDFAEKSRMLLDELAQVASLLFTVEEVSHSVTATRVPFVQQKLKLFVEHLGLSDFLDNVNKRRQRLEERIHDEMTRVSQGYMERITRHSFYISVTSMILAVIVGLGVPLSLESKHTQFEDSIAQFMRSVRCEAIGPRQPNNGYVLSIIIPTEGGGAMPICLPNTMSVPNSNSHP